MTTLSNESAFPIKDECAGLTKREYFSAMAMQGLLSNPVYNNPNEKSKMVSVPNLTKAAICYADALIEELNKI